MSPEFFTLCLSALWCNHLVLEHQVGLPHLLGYSNSLRPAIRMALILLLALPLATSLSMVVNLLLPAGLSFGLLTGLILLPLSALCVLIAWRFVEFVWQKRSSSPPPWLMASNGAVFGGLLLSLQLPANAMWMLGFSILLSAGFSLVLLMLLAAKQQGINSQVPRSFRGVPLALFTLGLASLAMSGFAPLFLSTTWQ